MYRDNFIQILYEKNTTNNKKHNKPYMKKKKEHLSPRTNPHHSFKNLLTFFLKRIRFERKYTTLWYKIVESADRYM